MLARYKKGGGIIELVKLIEDSGEPKRSQLLNMIRTEDPEFAQRVEARVFTYEGFKKLPEGVMAEIISSVPVKFLVMALTGETPEFITFCEKCLGKMYNEYKQEKDNFAANPANPNQIEAARRKILSEARKVEAGGRIKLIDPSLIEAADKAIAGGGKASAPGAPAASGATASTASAGAAGAGGTAKADEAMPSIESFKIEAPPGGLMGERFETWIKNQLGIK
jgi:hypothetical protein